MSLDVSRFYAADAAIEASHYLAPHGHSESKQKSHYRGGWAKIGNRNKGPNAQSRPRSLPHRKK